MKASRYKPILFFALFVLFTTTNVYAQWKNVAPNLLSNLPGKYVIGGGGIITHHNGILWVAFDDVWISIDSGKAWSLRSPFSSSRSGIVMDMASYDERIAAVSTKKGQVYITTDQGFSWRDISPPARGAILGICFAGSPKNIITCTNEGDIFVTTDGGGNWSINHLDITVFNVRSGSGGTAYAIAGPTKGGGKLYKTSDAGQSWIPTPGIFDWDSFSVERDLCDTTVFYISNEEILAPIDQFSSIYVSHNTGSSWTLNHPNSLPYYCGSIAVSENAVFAQTYSNVERSTDQGQSWKFISGPPNTLDTRFVTAMNDNIVFAVDSQGSIWETLNSGGDSLFFPKNGKLSFSDKILFAKDSFACNNITRYIKYFTSHCNPPDITNLEIVGKAASNYSLIPIVGDSIGVIFSPTKSGQLTASLLVSLSDGTSDTILLQGFGIPPHPLSIATTDQPTDTIGGSVNVPISINGLDHEEDIDLVLQYDKQLIYRGSYSPANVLLDIPGEEWSGRSKLHIAQAKPNVILGYARFDVFNDSLTPQFHVTFDSVTILTTKSPCQYILPASVTSTITPPLGCGIQTISRFIHDSTMPQLRIIPNPTSGDISITSSADLGEVSVAVYDMLGVKRSVNYVSIGKNSPVKVVLPLANGVYDVRVSYGTTLTDLPVIVTR